MRKTDVLFGTLTFVVLIVVWQILASLGISNLKYLPTPIQVAVGGAQIVGEATFWEAVAHTVLVSLWGSAIGCIIGIVAGVVIGLSRTVQNWTLTSIDTFRAIPIIAILPVMVLIYGLTTQMELYLIIYGALWLVLINTIAGVSNVRPLLRDVSKTLRLGRFMTIGKIILPTAAGPISVGVSLALTHSLVIAVVAEMIGNPAGVGHEIISSQSALRSDQMFAYIVVTGILGLLFNFGLQRLYRLLRPGLITVRGGAR